MLAWGFVGRARECSSNTELALLRQELQATAGQPGSVAITRPPDQIELGRHHFRGTNLNQAGTSIIRELQNSDNFQNLGKYFA